MQLVTFNDLCTSTRPHPGCIFKFLNCYGIPAAANDHSVISCRKTIGYQRELSYLHASSLTEDPLG